MAYEVEVTISSAKDLKNVNWRHGDLKPYAVIWLDPNNKCTTKVDDYGNTSPIWNQSLVIPMWAPIKDSILSIDIVHVNAAEDTKPLIGSARLQLRDIVDEVGIGGRSNLNLKLKRPSGRPQGKLEVKVTVRQPPYRAPDHYQTPTYGVTPPEQYSNYPYRSQYQMRDPHVGYSYQKPEYNQGQYGGYRYDGGSYSEEKKKKQSKYGLGTGLAVGAVAGVLGGLAIAEGVDYVEDKIAEDAAEKVEDDLGCDGSGYGGD